MAEFDIEKYGGNPPSIKRRTREKIALVFLVLLIAIGIAVVGWYFTTANTFTVVATKVDDRVGTMEHYTTLVYSGVRIPDNLPDVATSPDTSEATNITLPETEKVYASDVRDAYKNKGSDVMTLDVVSILNSEETLVYSAGSKRIGLFSVNQYASASTLSEISTSLKSQKVDVIICVTKRSVMLGSFDGIDCVLCTETKSPSETSEGRVGSCLIARAAEIGSVGALNISSSNVVSDKIYSPKVKASSTKSN